MSIYRYKIQTPQLIDEIIDFSNYRKFEDRQTLKESFETWYTSTEIIDLIHRENHMLTLHNYDFNKGTIKEKIFKSIKYYYIKKALGKLEKNQKPNDPSRNCKTIFNKKPT